MLLLFHLVHREAAMAVGLICAGASNFNNIFAKSPSVPTPKGFLFSLQIYYVMSKFDSITCPISTDRINENAARTVAFLVILLTLGGLYFNSWPLFLLLGLDFGFRAFGPGQFSLLRQTARWFTQLLNLPEKPTDAAPKRFAAGIGWVFSLVIAGLLALHWFSAAVIVAGVLVFCAFLEGAWGYCLGCVVYAALVRPFLKEKS